MIAKKLHYPVRELLSAATWPLMFALETRNPKGHELVTNRDEEDWFVYRNVEGRAVRVSGMQNFDPIAQIIHWTTFRRWSDDQGPRTRETHIACRFFYPQELAALLHCNGFKIVQQYGSWKKAPLSGSSSTIISICARGRLIGICFG
jgi:hypothetical protein